MLKAAIFDFDGTLYDSMSIWESAGANYLHSLGVSPKADLLQHIGNLSLAQCAAFLQADYGLPLSVEAIMAGINRTVEDYYFYEAPPKENIRPFLEYLRQRGIPMVIATATDSYQIEAALNRCGLGSFFSKIFTCSEVGHGKDEPDIFLAAQAFLGLPRQDIAVFEDAHYAATTAKALDFALVGVFDRYEKRAAELQALCDLYILGYTENGPEYKLFR